MAKNKDGEIMAKKKLSDFDKAVNYIKKIIKCDNSIKIPNDILEDLRRSLGFNISLATIEQNIKEQHITYKEIIVDSVFFHKYMQKQRKVIIQSLDFYSNNLTTKLDKFKYVYKEVIKMIHEEYEQESFTNPFLKDNLTQVNKITWDSLVRYVKYNVLKYSVDQKIGNNIITKLKELSNGRIMGNKNHNAICNYSYENILLTFKYSYFEIEKATTYKSFDNDMQKFSYICAIVKNNINDVINKIENSKKSEEKLLKTDFSHLKSEQANYYQRTEECLSDLADLW